MAAVQTTQSGQPVLMCLSRRPSTKKSIGRLSYLIDQLSALGWSYRAIVEIAGTAAITATPTNSAVR